MRFLDKEHWEIKYYQQTVTKDKAELLLDNKLLYIKFKNQIVELNVNYISEDQYVISKKLNNFREDY
jgi:hypothetical protein